LEAALFAVNQPSNPPKAEEDSGKALPDFAKIHEQRQRHRHLTLQVLWEGYKQANPEGLGYSRFCELCQRWRGKLDVVLRKEYKAGKKLFVDWAGAPIPIHDREGGHASRTLVCCGAGRQFPHVCGSERRRADGELAGCAHPSVQILRAACPSSLCPATPRPA
jgi:hypothetical protein